MKKVNNGKKPPEANRNKLPPLLLKAKFSGRQAERIGKLLRTFLDRLDSDPAAFKLEEFQAIERDMILAVGREKDLNDLVAARAKILNCLKGEQRRNNYIVFLLDYATLYLVENSPGSWLMAESTLEIVVKVEGDNYSALEKLAIAQGFRGKGQAALETFKRARAARDGFSVDEISMWEADIYEAHFRAITLAEENPGVAVEQLSTTLDPFYNPYPDKVEKASAIILTLLDRTEAALIEKGVPWQTIFIGFSREVQGEERWILIDEIGEIPVRFQVRLFRLAKNNNPPSPEEIERCLAEVDKVFARDARALYVWFRLEAMLEKDDMKVKEIGQFLASQKKALSPEVFDEIASLLRIKIDEEGVKLLVEHIDGFLFKSDEPKKPNELRAFTQNVWGMVGNIKDKTSREVACSRIAEMLGRETNIPQTLLTLGRISVFLRDFETAIACFDRILETDPVHEQAVGWKGDALLMQGKIEEAASFVMGALMSAKGKNVRFSQQLSEIYLLMPEAFKARASINRALRIKPESIRFLLTNVRILIRCGEVVKAQQEFDRVAKRIGKKAANKMKAQLSFAKADLLVASKDYQKAISAYRGAIQLLSNSFDTEFEVMKIRYDLAYAFQYSNRLQEAVNEAGVLLEKYPFFSLAYEPMIWPLIRAGKGEPALQRIKKLMNSPRGIVAEVFAYLVMLSFDEKHADRAGELFGLLSERVGKAKMTDLWELAKIALRTSHPEWARRHLGG
jgi:tetratricopeptide (TPR) repeat protein